MEKCQIQPAMKKCSTEPGRRPKCETLATPP
jgi:hypothetical protein